MTLPIKITRLSDRATIPTKSNRTDAGWDLYAVREGVLGIGQRRTFDLEIAVAIPEGWYMRIEPRSGLAAGYGVQVMAGVVDASYRGSVKVILHNAGSKSLVIAAGDRIAQATFHRVPDVVWVETDDLGDTDRGSGGFGSSGV